MRRRHYQTARNLSGEKKSSRRLARIQNQFPQEKFSKEKFR
jgi:hypothetical protein